MSVVGAVTGALVSRVDSWVNALTGLGTLRDKVMHAQIVPGARLTVLQLESLYNDDDLAQRIVDKVPREATRRGFKLVLEGKDDDDDADATREIMEDLKRIGLLQHFREAWIWGRLYGGGAVFVGADDGLSPDQPLNEQAIREIKFLNVLKRPQLTIKKRNEDVNSPDFGKPELFEVNTSSSAVLPTPTGILIHASRLIMFDGALTARTQGQNPDGWDDSVLQRVHSVLQQTVTSFQSVAHLVSDASQGVLKIADLVDLIAADGQEALRSRIHMMDLCRSVCRMILVDADRENFERVATSFAGLPDIMDRQMMRVAAAAEMPLTILFGRSPAGLNSTGESDIRGWYDTVGDAQTDKLQPRIERFLRIYFAAKNAPTRGVVPERWKIEFNPLWQPTEKEQAEVLKIKADTHVALAGATIMMPAESALALAADFPTIDVEHRRELMEADIAAGLRPGESDEPEEEDDLAAE